LGPFKIHGSRIGLPVRKKGYLTGYDSVGKAGTSGEGPTPRISNGHSKYPGPGLLAEHVHPSQKASIGLPPSTPYGIDLLLPSLCMYTCRDCPSTLPPDQSGVHPSFRRVLCDDCKRRVRRESRRRGRGRKPKKVGPAPRARKESPAALPGSKQSRLIQRVRSYVNSLKDRPCHDCGLSFPPVCMDFDHRPTEVKGREVSVCRSRAQVDAEVGKCDLVCACCHRLRTEARRLSALGTTSDPSSPA
jgi:hypothetical protein